MANRGRSGSADIIPIRDRAVQQVSEDCSALHYLARRGSEAELSEENDNSEAMANAERELAADAEWKRIQQNTFTRWANEHLRQAGSSISDLEEDLSDGIKLIYLIQVLSGKKIPKYNKKYNFRSQKLENVSIALDFLESEGVTLVNIDSTDIVDKKLKLILGLIWTLILHYAISMKMWDGPPLGGSAQVKTPKQRLMDWIQDKMTDLPITNFQNDWKNGKAVGALVDSVAPGLCPNWEDWDPNRPIENATEAMDLADKWLNVPKLLTPEELVNPNVDEQSMMTYLSQFPNAKLKPGAPLKQKMNPKKVRAYGPGIEPHGCVAKAPAKFIVETFGAGEGGELTVKVFVSETQEEIPAKVIWNNDRKRTYSVSYFPEEEGVFTVSVFYDCKNIPNSPYTVNVEGFAGNASKVEASGPGLEPEGVVVNKPTYFDIYTNGAGKGKVEVIILDPAGKKDSVPLEITSITGEPGVYRCDYVSTILGLHSVNVFFAGNPIPKSPFGVKVSPASNPSRVWASGRGLQPNGIRILERVDFKVYTEGAGEGNVSVKIIGPGGQTLETTSKAFDEYITEYRYAPVREGRHVVMIYFGNQEIPKSPFEVNVGPTKTSKIKAYGPGLKGGIVHLPAKFTVETHGETGNMGFSIEGPSKAAINCTDNGDGSAHVDYLPTAVGEYAVHILIDNEDIPGSPYMATILPQTDYDPSLVKCYGPGLINGVKPNVKTNFTIDTTDAGKAPLSVSIMDELGEYEPQLENKSEGIYEVSYIPRKGQHKQTIMVNYGGVAVPKSPFLIQTDNPVDSSRVIAYGPGIEAGARAGQPMTFTVDSSKGGPGELDINIDSSKKRNIPTKIQNTGNGLAHVTYETDDTGPLSIDIKFDDTPIPQSPISVTISPSLDVSKVKINNLESVAFVDSLNDFTVDTTALPSNKKSTITCKISNPSKLSSVIQTNVSKISSGVYQIIYTPTEEGPLNVDLKCDGAPLNGSPFSVRAINGFDSQKVVVNGDGLLRGYVNQNNGFNVKTNNAGKGVIGLDIEGPSKASMKCIDNKDGSCLVNYLPIEDGEYDISVKFGDEHVPGSPFKVPVTYKDGKKPPNASKVKAYGPGLSPDKVTPGKLVKFTLDSTQTGPGEIIVEISDLNDKLIGRKQPSVIEKERGIHEVTYLVPGIEEPYQISVKYGGDHIPGSIFDMSTVHQYQVESRESKENETTRRGSMNGRGIMRRRDGSIVEDDMSDNYKSPVHIKDADGDGDRDGDGGENHDVKQGDLAVNSHKKMSPIRNFANKFSLRSRDDKESEESKSGRHKRTNSQDLGDFKPEDEPRRLGSSDTKDNWTRGSSNNRGKDNWSTGNTSLDHPDLKDRWSSENIPTFASSEEVSDLSAKDREMSISSKDANLKVNKSKNSDEDDSDKDESHNNDKLNKFIGLKDDEPNKVLRENENVISSSTASTKRGSILSNQYQKIKGKLGDIKDNFSHKDKDMKAKQEPLDSKLKSDESFETGDMDDLIGKKNKPFSGDHSKSPRVLGKNSEDDNTLDDYNDPPTTSITGKPKNSLDDFSLKSKNLPEKIEDHDFISSNKHPQIVSPKYKESLGNDELSSKGILSRKLPKKESLIVKSSETLESDNIPHSHYSSPDEYISSQRTSKDKSSPESDDISQKQDFKKPKDSKYSLFGRFKDDSSSPDDNNENKKSKSLFDRQKNVKPVIGDEYYKDYDSPEKDKKSSKYNKEHSPLGRESYGRVSPDYSSKEKNYRAYDDNDDSSTLDDFDKSGISRGYYQNKTPENLKHLRDTYIQPHNKHSDLGQRSSKDVLFKRQGSLDDPRPDYDDYSKEPSAMRFRDSEDSLSKSMNSDGQNSDPYGLGSNQTGTILKTNEFPNSEYTTSKHSDDYSLKSNNRRDSDDFPSHKNLIDKNTTNIEVLEGRHTYSVHESREYKKSSEIYSGNSKQLSNYPSEREYDITKRHSIKDSKERRSESPHNDSSPHKSLNINAPKSPTDTNAYHFRSRSPDDEYMSPKSPKYKESYIEGSTKEFSSSFKNDEDKNKIYTSKNKNNDEYHGRDSWNKNHGESPESEYDFGESNKDTIASKNRFSSEYYPIELYNIPVPSNAKHITATVITPKGSLETPVLDNSGRGTVNVFYQPHMENLHVLEVKTEDGDHVQGSPYKFHSSRSTEGKVRAYGEGLTHGVCGNPAAFTISTKGSGSGGLSLAIEGPSKTEISCHDNKDGTIIVNYLPTAPGEYKISAKFADEHIKGSPFTCKVTGEGKKRNQISVGSSSELSLPQNLSDYDLKSLSAFIVSPSGLEEPCYLKKLPKGDNGISFTPREIGEHLVSVKRNGKHITNSPFKVNVSSKDVGDASKVLSYGPALQEGKTQKENHFTVDTRNAGYGGLSLSIEGPSKAKIDCRDNEDGQLDVTYKPSEPGIYIINMKFADKHVPGSPFSVLVTGDGLEKKKHNISRIREAVPTTEVGSPCSLTFKMPSLMPSDLKAAVTSPHGKSSNASISTLEEGLYAVSFVPRDLGIHTVNVKYRELDIPGSPFQFTVGPLQDGGAHLVRAGGPGLERGIQSQSANFNVWTREAGQGSLAISVEGPSKAEVDFKDRKDGSCHVSYIVKEPGEYSVGIRFNESHIPGSPYKVYILPSGDEAERVRMSNIVEAPVLLDTPQTLLLNMNGADGNVECKLVAPSGREDDCFITPLGDGEHSVRFVPKEEGLHYLHAKLNGIHIPGSPYKVIVGKWERNHSSVSVHGEGIKRGRTGSTSTFVIDTLGVGAGTLSITIDGPSKVDLVCNEVETGYEVSYVPLVSGKYYVSVRYNGNNVTRSPFTVLVEGEDKHENTRKNSRSSMTMETMQRTSYVRHQYSEQHTSSRRSLPGPLLEPSNAKAVTLHGSGLKHASIYKTNTFSVDCGAAGNNILFVGVSGPETHSDEVVVRHLGNKKYSVEYTVQDKANYIIIVKYGDEHVPGSPFHIEAN